VWNGYDLSRPTFVERVFQEWLALLETGVRVVGTGNSDSHLVRYYWAGYPRTYVYAPDGARDPATILTALRAGRVFVTSGPFLEVSIAGSLPGDRVVAQGGEVLVDVVVRAPAYIDVEELQVFVGRTLVTTLPIRHAAPVMQSGTVAAGEAPPIVRYQGQLRVPVERDAPLVVRVRSDTPMDDFLGRRAVIPMAFTNPIFVDADGDGCCAGSQPSTRACRSPPSMAQQRCTTQAPCPPPTAASRATRRTQKAARVSCRISKMARDAGDLFSV
jgi:hypothetical protein